LKRTIEAYNKDDCISTEKLRDWLEARRPDATVKFNVELPRPPLGEQEINEELTEKQRLVRDLEERLTGSITTIEAEQTPDEKSTWMVRHLLDWHRREDKSTWWRYYDLIGKSDEELIDEPEAIAGLECFDKVDPGGRSRSFVWRYRYPPQEMHDVKLGYADDPQLGQHKSTGEIVALDEESGTVDIRRAKTWDGPHPRSIVQVIVIEAKEQKRALMRFAEWVVTNGIAAGSPEWQAARDLIRRQHPRVIGLEPGSPLVAATDIGSEAARRLAVALNGTTLAVQGPPGSGKTYTGARMILDLVRAGRRVGITSNSHKVISNMVEAVLEAGDVRIIQKGKPDEVFDHHSVKQAPDNVDVRDALLSGEYMVAAGTPWLWSAEDLIGSVDTLFVDEAGQVSLANVVAVSPAARNIVLLGDPQQLEQPTQGVHPEGAGRSALGHLLGLDEVVPADRGVFLERTWRMHDDITAYTSELFYEGKLLPVEGLSRQTVLGSGDFAGSGLRWVPIKHDGNTNQSAEEARAVARIWNQLVGQEWVDADGARWPIEPEDIVIVSPFNAHRLLIKGLLGEDARIGTVDKFQGQEAPISIYTMATSRPEDAPRGMNFLCNLHRLNVATSRARALAIVVASDKLLDVVPKTPDQLRMANGLAAFVDYAAAAVDAAVDADVDVDVAGPSDANLQIN
jgi:uncharacterized protein